MSRSLIYSRVTYIVSVIIFYLDVFCRIGRRERQTLQNVNENTIEDDSADAKTDSVQLRISPKYHSRQLNQ